MILLTGATGFIGSHIALELLSRGKKVRALYRHPEHQDRTREIFSFYGKAALVSDIDWVQGDITDIPSLEPAFEGVTEVIHGAALISFDPKDAGALRKTNIEGTANMVNLSLAFGVKKFAYLSSVAALGDPIRPTDPVSESTVWNPEKPHSDYAISKHGAEMEVWRGFQEGLPVLIFCPGVVLGPVASTDQQGSGQLFASVKRGLPFYTEGSNGFIGVKDVAESVCALLESGTVGEKFILVAEHRPLKWVVEEIASAFGKKKPGTKAGKTLLKFAVSADWLLHLLGRKRQLYRDSVPALLSQSTYETWKWESVRSQHPEPLETVIRESVTLMEKR